MAQNNKNRLLILNDVKNYYNKIFTSEVLISLQKDIKLEDLMFSYNYYSHLIYENNNVDEVYVIPSDYLNSDDDLDYNINDNNELTCFLLRREERRNKSKANYRYSNDEMINYFDPLTSEEEFEEKIEKTFEFLNNLLLSIDVGNNDMNNNHLDGSNSSNKLHLINQICINLNVRKEDDNIYKLCNIQVDRSQINQITLIIIAYIITSIFKLSMGRKLIFSNKNINNMLFRTLHLQNIYIQIYTMKNLKKYIVEDAEFCDIVHLKMIKVCLFSKSLCSFNRANHILLLLLREKKNYSHDIFDFYFLRKLKYSLEHSDNIERLRLLDFITDCINVTNDENVCNLFKLKVKSSQNKTAFSKNENTNVNNNNNNNNNNSYSNNNNGINVDISQLYNTDIQLKLDKQFNRYCDESDDEDIYTDNIIFSQIHGLKDIMNKHNYKIKDIYLMIRINLFKYLHMIYLKDDLLLKINVLEIYSKLVQNIQYCDGLHWENCYFLYNVLYDLKEKDDYILHLSIMNSLISYSFINESVLLYLISAHSNILIKIILQYIDNKESDVEKLIVGIKAFGFFFSYKESSNLLLNLNKNAHLVVINHISTHSNTNVLLHAINIWLKILISKPMDDIWFKNIIHSILLEKIILILKEIDDNNIQTNIFKLLHLMIPYDIATTILNEQWIIKSLHDEFENKAYDLKISRHKFFVALYQHNKDIISNNAYADNLIRNFIEATPKRY
ncbi:hypothetical protein CYL21_4749 [Plasmodium falciparum NF54]|uniref:Uncharacterized protein n=3 Tax=Plasmodium falciparum TaxID=5833 RepID=Q8I5X7_PLAF7|nr:conserved Plasmodium protein, unknown function [Plasmodium falciparum 3D7]EWC87488.1 hypothetical protein PFNF54_03613 [Plasmodium falciparum NF54]KAF4327262.1 hypothetical protein CYL21_4749 [Plasmodium falciparum NF54]PKC48279.1 hypothetical protein CK202_1689 [Plasmodium falciparum NF54]CZT99230.1 conserved Plasmodium protein, unknown function [Plasmodium falciparum 3D7]|eukprot:XP_001350477.1 conserved Plasmodium protein, unknown function [Plasmodium falciparum 3D7]